jgi:hypothetical protein
MKNPLLADNSYPAATHPGLRNLLSGMRRVVCVPFGTVAYGDLLQQMTAAEAQALWRWCNYDLTWEAIP